MAGIFSAFIVNFIFDFGAPPAGGAELLFAVRDLVAALVSVAVRRIARLYYIPDR